LISNLLLFDKKQKFSSLFKLIFKIRRVKYDLVVNVNRHFSSGLITAFSGANKKIGFNKNPFSFLFTKSFNHDWNLNELERNQKLIEGFTDPIPAKPKLYPSESDFSAARDISIKPYLTISPFSVWPTKQLKFEKWIELIDGISSDFEIYLMGAPSDRTKCDIILKQINRINVFNICGKYNILVETAFISLAKMNFVLDSAPMHICSAVNAAQTVIYCSTSPEFGFKPFSDISKIVKTDEHLSCQPCGKHGHKICPKKHFKCGDISAKLLLSDINSLLNK
jgi:heptosyltransferase-2